MLVTVRMFNVPSLSQNNHQNCFQDYLQIHPEALGINVNQIVFNSLVPGEMAAAINLGQTGYPAPHRQPPPLPEAVGFQMFGQSRPRPNDGHIALQHIPQLGQFVNLQAPDNTADPRHLRVISPNLLIQPPPGIIRHTAKLMKPEDNSILPQPLLVVEYWSAVGQQDKQAD